MLIWYRTEQGALAPLIHRKDITTLFIEKIAPPWPSYYKFTPQFDINVVTGLS